MVCKKGIYAVNFNGLTNITCLEFLSKEELYQTLCGLFLPNNISITSTGMMATIEGVTLAIHHYCATKNEFCVWTIHDWAECLAVEVLNSPSVQPLVVYSLKHTQLDLQSFKNDFHFILKKLVLVTEPKTSEINNNPRFAPLLG